jgi:hypothetical protein
MLKTFKYCWLFFGFNRNPIYRNTWLVKREPRGWGYMLYISLLGYTAAFAVHSARPFKHG